MCWAPAAALLSAQAAQAQPVGYQETLLLAGTEQPVLQAREARIEARRETAGAAAELPDPRLTAGLMNLPVTGPEAFDPTGQMMTMFQVGVEQEIPNLAKRRARTGIAEAEVGVARAELAHAEHMVRLGAGQAWIALAFAQRRLVLADETLEHLRELVPVARSAVASGSARPAESLGIRRALLEIEDARTRIEAEREAAQARLQRYFAIEEPVAVGAVPPADIDPARLRATLEHNPEFLLAGAAVDRAEAAVDLARADKRPDFGLGVSYGVRDRDYGDLFSVMGSVTLPLFSGRRQDPRIRAAQAEETAARAERDDRLRELEAQFEADLATWRSAYRQWQRAEEELLPLARDRAEMETASYAAGRAELLDLIEAMTALALLRLEILEREAATVEAATILRLTYTEHRP
jgi:cobalt-zinc-cadmium efflux system outer membrane protein